MKKNKHTLKKILYIFLVIVPLSTKLYGMDYSSKPDKSRKLHRRKLMAHDYRKLSQDEFDELVPRIINRARKDLNQSQTNLSEIEKSREDLIQKIEDLESEIKSTSLFPCCDFIFDFIIQRLSSSVDKDKEL